MVLTNSHMTMLTLLNVLLVISNNSFDTQKTQADIANRMSECQACAMAFFTEANILD